MLVSRNLVRRLFCLINSNEIYNKLAGEYRQKPQLETIQAYLKRQNFIPLYHIFVSSRQSVAPPEFIQHMQKIDEISDLESDQQINVSANIKKKLSQAFLVVGDIPRAREYADDAYKIIKMMDKPYQVQLATFQHHLAETLILNHQSLDQANQLLRDAVSIFETAIEREQDVELCRMSLANIYARISALEYSRKQVVKAKVYIDKSVEMWEKLGPEQRNSRLYLSALRTKCIILKKFKEHEQILQIAEQVLAHCNDIQNRLWFLNVLVKEGKEQYKKQYEELLQSTKKVLNQKQFEVLKKGHELWNKSG